ncbi:MAG: acetolactate synthase small subunit [archaeon]|nr:acetolactate synthase small subunit [archaeon]
MKKFFLKLIVDNNRGVMGRIATLLARKGYNITSVSVGSHVEKGEASIVLTIWGSQEEVESAKNMLGKLINVISSEMYPEEDVIEIEDCLIKIKKVDGIEEKLKGYLAGIIKENNDFAIIKAVDHPYKVESLIKKCQEEFEVIDINRSGTNVMSIK